jgi:hypothetical protein
MFARAAVPVNYGKRQWKGMTGGCPTEAVAGELVVVLEF